MANGLDDEKFKTVTINSRTHNPCSPEEPGHRFLGILINAPKKVSFKKDNASERGKTFAIIPICGLYLLKVKDQAKYSGKVEEAMRLVAVSKETGKEYSGRLIAPEPVPTIPDAPLPSLSPEQLADMATGGDFNPNLAEQVPLPAALGSYDVYVELGERDSDDYLKSNVVCIEIIEEKHRSPFNIPGWKRGHPK